MAIVTGVFGMQIPFVFVALERNGYIIGGPDERRRERVNVIRQDDRVLESIDGAW